MPEKSLAQLQAEANELRDQATQLRNQANELMQRSELVEAQVEQTTNFFQTSEQQHDELSGQIEGTTTEEIERVDSEEDSSSGSEADLEAALENQIELWQGRFRSKRRFSNLLTSEEIHEQNSKIEKRKRHPEPTLAAFYDLLESLQDDTPVSRAEIKGRLCCGRCGIYDGAEYDPLLTSCLHIYYKQCYDFLQVYAEEQGEEDVKCKQCNESMEEVMELDVGLMSHFREYAVEDLSGAYLDSEYESGDGVSDTQSHKGDGEESSEVMDDFIVPDSEEHDSAPKHLLVARLLFQRRQIGGLQLAAFGLPTRLSPQPDDLWVDASDLKILSDSS